MPQLDGLRTIAVFSVLYMHWFSPILPVGTWGVILFFVLSGFLITRSLDDLKASGVSLGTSAARFFGRRSLRLFPPYYVLLAIGVLVSDRVRAEWPWYALYLSNVRLALEGHAIPMLRTWSLAVEEQFYIFWFFAVMLLQVRGRAVLSVAAIGLSVLFRLCVPVEGWWSALLPGAMDALALGGLLALVRRPAPGWAGAGCLLFLGAAVVWTLFPPANLHLKAALVPLLIAVASLFAIWQAREGFGGWVGKLLGWGPVTYLGRISYGIYLYHILTGELFASMPGVWRFATGGAAMFFVHVAITVAIASASYHFFERPIMDLMPRRRQPRPAAA